MTYWLCILTRDNWEKVQQYKTWGVAERHRNTIAQVDPGDHFLFYVVSEKRNNARLESAVVGRAEAASAVYKDTKKIFSSKKREVYPLRINLTTVESFPEIPFKPLIFELEFIKNKKRWSGHLQGKAMRVIPERDFNTLVR
jgi:predicted RNA-binding protein